ncbi:MAG: sugar phosphate isomerase/epimerase, partial [Clostridia bacterium]|nr:sugar phosphate isomerase/epimerase [Clostridia bacterium]
YDKERYSTPKESEIFAAECEKYGLIFHSIHAPFYGMDDIWHDESGELSKIIEADLFDSIDECVAAGVKLVIMHAIIGMDRCTPTDLGIKRLEKIIDHAVKKNITIGFENTEGEVYLKRIFDTFGDIPNIGFCFDSGHELCYNYSRNLLKEYGRYLVSTHLNDNLGMTDVYNMTFLDDSHLLPFDGIRNWKQTAEDLRKCSYEGILTFELNPKSKPGRHANDIYNNLTYEQYICKAYERACRFRELYKNTK